MVGSKPSLLSTFVVVAFLLATASGARAQAQDKALAARVAALEEAVVQLRGGLAAANKSIAVLQKTVDGQAAQIAALNARDAKQTAVIDSLSALIGRLQLNLVTLQGNSVLTLNGILTYDSGTQTARFSGVDLQIVNGVALGTINGKGNLIVGYNSARTGAPVCSIGQYGDQPTCEVGGGIWASDHKSGSHNLVVGEGNAYSASGGVVFGRANAVTGPGATVVGGQDNLARGFHSVVSGGQTNLASSTLGSVSGGFLNTASGLYSSVSGGAGNEAIGEFSSVSGGTVSKASGVMSSVSGGQLNEAAGLASSVSGGMSRSAASDRSWAAGGLSEPN